MIREYMIRFEITMSFIIEGAKENISNYSQGNVKVLLTNCY